MILSLRYFVFLFFVGDSSMCFAHIEDLKNRANLFFTKYELTNTDMKLVDNRGNGYEELYGTRNFRVVLTGVLYRGGANNVYHQESPRENQNPLQTDGLTNLCEENFSEAIYLYSQNFSIAPRQTHCVTTAKANALEYKQISGLSGDKVHSILAMIYDNIHNPEAGPIYAHCWNGWHASGYVAAISLRQFCDWSGQEAIDYWNRNTDGNNSSDYDSIRRRIQNFKKIPEYVIDPETREIICPK